MKHLLHLHCSVLLLGGTALFSQLISLDALDIIAYRSIIAAVALLLLSAILRQSFKVDTRMAWWIIVIGGLLMSFHWVTYFKAMQVSSVSIGIITLFSFPVFTALFEPLFDKQRIKMTDLGLAFVVFLGVVLTVSGAEDNKNALLGALYGIPSAITYALRNIITRRYLKQYSPTVIMGFQAVVIAITLLPFSLHLAPSIASQDAWLLLLLGIVFTAIPHAQITYSFQKLSAKSVAFIQCLQVVYAISFAYWILEESSSWLTLLGGSIVIGVALLETRRQ